MEDDNEYDTERGTYDDKMIDGRLCDKEWRLYDGCMMFPSLPVEIWTMIIRWSKILVHDIRFMMEQDSSSRHNLQNVNKMF